MKKLTKILVVALALSLLVCAFVFTASAEENNAAPFEVKGVSYNSWAEAYAAAQAGDTIAMTNDYTFVESDYTSGITYYGFSLTPDTGGLYATAGATPTTETVNGILIDKEITLHLGGHTLTSAATEGIVFYVNTDGLTFRVTGNGKISSAVPALVISRGDAVINGGATGMTIEYTGTKLFNHIQVGNISRHNVDASGADKGTVGTSLTINGKVNFSATGNIVMKDSNDVDYGIVGYSTSRSSSSNWYGAISVSVNHTLNIENATVTSSSTGSLRTLIVYHPVGCYNAAPITAINISNSYVKQELDAAVIAAGNNQGEGYLRRVRINIDESAVESLATSSNMTMFQPGKLWANVSSMQLTANGSRFLASGGSTIVGMISANATSHGIQSTAVFNDCYLGTSGSGNWASGGVSCIFNDSVLYTSGANGLTNGRPWISSSDADFANAVATVANNAKMTEVGGPVEALGGYGFLINAGCSIFSTNQIYDYTSVSGALPGYDATVSPASGGTWRNNFAYEAGTVRVKTLVYNKNGSYVQAYQVLKSSDNAVGVVLWKDFSSLTGGSVYQSEESALEVSDGTGSLGIYFNATGGRQGKYTVYEDASGNKYISHQHSYVEGNAGSGTRPYVHVTYGSQYSFTADAGFGANSMANFKYYSFDFDMMTPTGKYDSGFDIQPYVYAGAAAYTEKWGHAGTLSLRQNDDGTAYWYDTNSKSNSSEFTTNAGEWHHFTYIAEIDPANLSGSKLYLYCDGELIGEFATFLSSDYVTKIETDGVGTTRGILSHLRLYYPTVSTIGETTGGEIAIDNVAAARYSSTATITPAEISGAIYSKTISTLNATASSITIDGVDFGTQADAERNLLYGSSVSLNVDYKGTFIPTAPCVVDTNGYAFDYEVPSYEIVAEENGDTVSFRWATPEEIAAIGFLVTVDGVDERIGGTLADAIARAMEGTESTIKLLKDITHTSTGSISISKQLTIDLNNFTLNIVQTLEKTPDFTIDIQDQPVTVENGTIDVTNTYAANNGKVFPVFNFNKNRTELNLNNLTVYSAQIAYAPYAKNVTFNINGGEYHVVRSASTATIGGLFENRTIMTANVTDAKIYLSGSNKLFSALSYNGGSDSSAIASSFTFTGCDIFSTSASSEVIKYLNGFTTATFNDCNIRGSLNPGMHSWDSTYGNQFEKEPTEENIILGEGTTISSGSTYNAVTEDGFSAVVVNDTYTFSVKGFSQEYAIGYVIAIPAGDPSFIVINGGEETEIIGDFALAYNSVADGGTIKLLADYAFSQSDLAGEIATYYLMSTTNTPTTGIALGKNITIDLGGYNLSSSGNTGIIFHLADNSRTLTITGEGKISSDIPLIHIYKGTVSINSTGSGITLESTTNTIDRLIKVGYEHPNWGAQSAKPTLNLSGAIDFNSTGVVSLSTADNANNNESIYAFISNAYGTLVNIENATITTTANDGATARSLLVSNSNGVNVNSRLGIVNVINSTITHTTDSAVFTTNANIIEWDRRVVYTVTDSTITSTVASGSLHSIFKLGKYGSNQCVAEMTISGSTLSAPQGNIITTGTRDSWTAAEPVVVTVTGGSILKANTAGGAIFLNAITAIVDSGCYLEAAKVSYNTTPWISVDDPEYEATFNATFNKGGAYNGGNGSPGFDDAIGAYTTGTYVAGDGTQYETTITIEKTYGGYGILLNEGVLLNTAHGHSGTKGYVNSSADNGFSIPADMALRSTTETIEEVERNVYTVSTSEGATFKITIGGVVLFTTNEYDLAGAISAADSETTLYILKNLQIKTDTNINDAEVPHYASIDKALTINLCGNTVYVSQSSKLGSTIKINTASPVIIENGTFVWNINEDYLNSYNNPNGLTAENSGDVSFTLFNIAKNNANVTFTDITTYGSTLVYSYQSTGINVTFNGGEYHVYEANALIGGGLFEFRANANVNVSNAVIYIDGGHLMTLASYNESGSKASSATFTGCDILGASAATNILRFLNAYTTVRFDECNIFGSLNPKVNDTDSTRGSEGPVNGSVILGNGTYLMAEATLLEDVVVAEDGRAIIPASYAYQLDITISTGSIFDVAEPTFALSMATKAYTFTLTIGEPPLGSYYVTWYKEDGSTIILQVKLEEGTVGVTAPTYTPGNNNGWYKVGFDGWTTVFGSTEKVDLASFTVTGNTNFYPAQKNDSTPTPYLTGAQYNLTLSSTITLNFYLPAAPAGVTNIVVKDSHGNVIDGRGVIIPSGAYYKLYELGEVRATELDTPFVITVDFDVDGLALRQTVTLSPYKYATSILADSNNAEPAHSAKTHTLIADMIRYSNQLEYAISGATNSTFDALLEEYGSLCTPFPSANDFGEMSTSLSGLESYIESITFEVSNYEPRWLITFNESKKVTDVTITVDGYLPLPEDDGTNFGSITYAVDSDRSTYSGNYITRAYMENMPIYNIDRIITITVTTEDGTEASAEYSLNTYFAHMSATGDTLYNYQLFLRAFRAFGESSAAYRYASGIIQSGKPERDFFECSHSAALSESWTAENGRYCSSCQRYIFFYEDYINAGTWGGAIYSSRDEAVAGAVSSYSAIDACHYYANSKSTSAAVGCVSGYNTYYLGAAYDKNGAVSEIETRTDTDWEGTYFVIDDRGLQITSAEFKTRVFGIRGNGKRAPDGTYYSNSGKDITATLVANSGVSEGEIIVAKGAKKLNFAPGMPMMIQLIDASIKHYIRSGGNQNDGDDQSEVILIDEFGNISNTTPVEWDYTYTAANFTAKAYPITDEPIKYSGLDNNGNITCTFENITWDGVDVSEYSSCQRMIMVRRSNVTIEGIDRVFTEDDDNTTPRQAYNGLVYVWLANNTVIKDMSVYQHLGHYVKDANGNTTNSLGSYEFSGLNSINTTWENCVIKNFFNEDGTVTYKGMFGTNYMRNMYLRNCFLNSFDSHSGAYNVTIEDSTFEHINFIGGGDIRLNNVTVYTPKYQKMAIQLREDYGSTWNGNLYMDNVTVRYSANDAPEYIDLVRAYYTNHYYGYTSYLPHNIYANNVRTQAYSRSDDNCVFANGVLEENIVSTNGIPIGIYQNLNDEFTEDIDYSTENANNADPKTCTQNIYLNNISCGILYPDHPFFANMKIYIDDVEKTDWYSERDFSAGGDAGSCLVEGTLITMADGSLKPIEELTIDDEILVFNHESGEYEPGKLWFTVHGDLPRANRQVLNLVFSDDTIIRIVHEHALFDSTLAKYVYLSPENADDYIGHEFLGTNGKVTLDNAYITTEEVKVYSPISERHLNVIANGMITATTSLFELNEMLNAYEYDSEGVYDAEKRAEDIAKYGVYEYAEFAHLFSLDEYNASPLYYLKVAVGKGLITRENIENLIKACVALGYMEAP